jgi:RimJ/RimL family protein N-acetyltransferase
MQSSWRQDADKLTFIACLPPSPIPTTITPGQDDAPSQMLGDINLFLVDNDDDEDDELNSNAINNDKSTSILGEIELMIALPSHHRKGYGRASLLAFLHYILTNTSAIFADYTAANSTSKQPQLSYLRVKISETNTKSIALFQSVGFIRTCAEANYFGEVELRLQVQENEKNVLTDLEKVKGWEGEPRVLGYGV